MNKKTNMLRIIGLAIILLVLVFLGVIENSRAATSYTRSGLQNRVVATALSYLYSHTYSDYEQHSIDDDDINTEGSFVHTYAFRTFNRPQDEVSRVNQFHIDCSGFATSTYVHSIGYYFASFYNIFTDSQKNYKERTKTKLASSSEMIDSMRHYYRGPSTQFFQQVAEASLSETPEPGRVYRKDYTGNKTYTHAGKITNSILVYYRKATDKTTASEVKSQLAEMLEPGDLFVRRKPSGGHVVVYVGNKVTGSGATSTGIIESKGSDLGRGTYTSGTAGKDVFSIRYTRSYEYMVNGIAKDWVFIILRPLNKFCGTGSSYTSCELSGDNLTKAQESTARQTLSKVNEEQFPQDASGKTISKYSSINVGDNITYTLRLRKRDTFPYCYNNSDSLTTYDTTKSDCGTGKTWTNISANNGSSASTVVKTITAKVPSGTTYVGCNRNCTCSATPCSAGSTLTWNFTSYDEKVNTSDTENNLFTVTYTVKPTSKGTITNTDGFKITNTANTNVLTMGPMLVSVNPTIRRLDEAKITGNTSSTGSDLTYAKNVYTNAYGNNWSFLTDSAISSAIFSKFGSKEDYDIVGSNSKTSTSATTTTAGKIQKMMVPGMYGGYWLRGNDSKDTSANRIDRIKYIDISDFEIGDIVFRKRASESSFKTYVYTGGEDKVFRESSSSTVNNKPGNLFARTLHNDRLFVVLRPSRIMAKISYNVNGATSAAPSPTLAYGTYKSMPAAPTRSGYTFAGWYTALSGGTKKVAGDALDVDSSTGLPKDTTLYAKWSAAIPTTSYCNSLTYTGKSQTLVKTAGTGYTWTAGTTRTAAGSQNVTATLSNGFIWSDGSTGTKTISCSIGKKSVPVTWGSTTSFVYNGSNQAPTAAATSGISGETINVTRTAEKNAGAHTSTASCSSVTGGQASCANYTLTGTTKSYTITKATPTITLSAASGSVVAGKTVTFTEKANIAGNFTNTSNNTTLATVSPQTASAAANTAKTETITGVKGGSTTISIVFTPNDTTNYSSASKTYNIKIIPGVAIPTAATYCKTGLVYSGSSQTLVKAASTGFTWSSGTSRTDAGSQNVTATIASGYSWNDGTTGTKTISCSIAPKTLTIPNTPTDKTYNGNNQNSGITCPTESNTTGTQSQTNAGTYTQTCTLKSTTNYIWNDSTTTAKTITWKINKKAATITAKGQTITYGNPISKTVNDVTVGGLITGHTLSSITLAQSTTNITTSGIITPSAAKILASGTDVTNNYNITYNTGKLTIKGITTTIPTTTYCNSLTFNGSSQTLVKTAGTGYKWDSSTTTATNAGTYTVKAILDAGHIWSDSTNTTKSITCKIAKATSIITVGTTQGISVVGKTITFNVKANVAGKFTVESTNTSVATATVISNEISANTNTPVSVSITSVGETTIKINFTPTSTNYNNAPQKTYSVTVLNAVTIPTSASCKSLTYNGSTQTLVNAAGTGYTWDSSTSSATNAGTYTVKAILSNGYRWNDNTTGEKTITCSIDRMTVTEPSCTARTYNGEEQTLLQEKTSGAYTNETIKGTNAGNYTTQLVLNKNYKWSSGTNVESNRTKTCKIDKAIPIVRDLEISTAGIVSFEGLNATSYEISTDGTNYSQIRNGDSYWNSITSNVGQRTIYVRAKNSDTRNYQTPSETISTRVNVHKLSLTADNNKGSVNETTYNVIEGVQLQTDTNKLKIIGVVPTRATNVIKTITATPKTGYTFDRWTGLVEQVNSNLSIEANFNIVTYTISYNLIGGTANNPNSYNINTDTFNLNNPTKEGYIFRGWTGSNGTTPQETVTITKGTTGNKTYIANYEPKKYEVIFETNGGNSVSSQNVGYGEKVAEPETPSKENYAFEGWYSDIELTNRYDFNSIITGPKTLYAKWVTGKFQITYNLDGGIANNITSYDANTPNYTLKTPTKEGYTFVGWTGSNGSTPQKTVIIYQGSIGNLHYTAHYEIKKYVVSFNTNGGSTIDNESVDYGHTVTKPNDPSKKGNTFIGWYKDSNLTEKYDFDSKVKENITLYAKWETNVYKVSFETNSGSIIEDMDVTYGEEIIEPTAPIKEGYTFKGWYSDSELTDRFTFGLMPDKNITIYASWEKSRYQVIFNTSGGTTIATQEIEYESTATKPTDPTKEGYTFDGWYSDNSYENIYNFDNSITKSIILYAKWNEIEYEITYNLDGGEATNPTSYTVDSDTFILNNPSKQGYRFIGWTGSNGNTPQETVKIRKGSIGNRNYIANYEITNYQIRFISNGGSEVTTQQVGYGEKVAEPVTPTKSGYAFEGWYTDDNLTNRYDFNTSVTKNIVLYANWITGKYQITFDLDGGFAENPTYYDIETPTFTLNSPVKEGYTFIGWIGTNGATPQETITITKGSTGNKTYKAIYSTKKYTINFNISGINPINKDYGESIDLPTPRQTGYTFVGWCRDQELTQLFTDTVMPAENLTLYAKWQINTYKVIFDTNGGNSIPDKEIIYNEVIGELSDAIKEGYEFKGWYTNEQLTEPFNITRMPANNITVYAKWKANTYTVTFETNGGTDVLPQEVIYNEKASRPTDPEKTGYEVEGWYTDSSLTTKYSFDERITKDLTLYAKWKEKEYRLTYILDGGTAENKATYTMSSETFTLNNPTKEGHTFIGWTGSNGNTPQETVTITNGSTGNKTYTANYRTNSYTISFETNGGNEISPITKNFGEKVSAPQKPVKEGYKFAGWFTDRELTILYSFTTIPSQNITLYAKWADNEYVILYELDGGVNDTSNPTTYEGGSVVTIKDPKKDGYIFDGWYKDENLTQRIEGISAKMEEDLILYAKWRIAPYQIIFETNGGTSKTSIELEPGDSIPSIPAAVRTGYTFKGWYTDVELTSEFNETTMPSHDLTLYAAWEINRYRISFNTNGGNEIETIEGDYNSPITEPVQPLREGYKFAGWYTDKELTKLFTFNTMPANNITLYAKWVNNSKNVITYVLNGGNNNIKNPTSYEPGEELVLYNPTKKGNKFLGWYLDGDFQTPIYLIDKDLSGDITLYAKWESKVNVKVPNTAKKIPLIIIILSVVFIITGGYIIINNKTLFQKAHSKIFTNKD